MAQPPHRDTPSRPPLPGLDERARRVLRAVVLDHIEAGGPVGSRQVAAREPGLEVSSATVRSVMADLEALGLLQKPHTSAGRIPTELGYRYYVDALLRLQAVRPEEQHLIERRTQPTTLGLEGLLAETTRLLHGLTHQAAVVAAPRPAADRLARIEFIPLREGRVLAVLVTRSGVVQNRLLSPPPGEPQLTPTQLGEAQEWLNRSLGDLTLEEARQLLARELDRERSEAAETRSRALRLGVQLVAGDAELSQGGSLSLHMEGQSALLSEPSLAQDLSRLKSLLVALGEKERILSVLDRAMQAEELTIFIGAECGLADSDLTVIAAPYRLGSTSPGIGGALVGTLGVIGPTRMDYARVVPIVELTARALGLALASG